MTSYVVIAAGTFIYAIVVLLLHPYGTRKDHEKRRVTNILSDHARNVSVIDEDLNKPLYERLIKPFIMSLSLKLAKLTPKKRSKSDSKNQQTDKLKKMLRQAGMSLSVDEYALIKIFVIIGIATLFGFICAILGLGSRIALGASLGALTGYTYMRFNLTSKITKRRELMEQQMPDVLDLLSVNVEAGLGFEQALLQVIGHFEGPLIDELTIAYREISMGRTRRDALILLAERCELDELKTFASSIVQAEQLGISIKNVLRTQAAAIRSSRRSKVEEKAQKVQVKMLLPMVGLIFPVLLIVLLGPAVVKILAVLL